MDGNVLVCDMGCWVMLFGCEILFLYCEIPIWISAILWCILFSYLDFHNAKQSGILHSVGWKLKDASKKSVRNFSFVRIEYLRTNRAMIQNMRFLGDWGKRPFYCRSSDRFTVGTLAYARCRILESDRALPDLTVRRTIWLLTTQWSDLWRLEVIG